MPTPKTTCVEYTLPVTTGSALNRGQSSCFEGLEKSHLSKTSYVWLGNPHEQSFFPSDVKEKLSHTNKHTHTHTHSHTQQGWSDRVRCLKTHRACNGITIISRLRRVQRDAPLDRSLLGLRAMTVRKTRPKWSLPQNVECFWVTVREPLGLEAQFNLRSIPEVLPICASLTLTLWH